MKTEILIAVLGAAAIAFVGYTEGYSACQAKHEKEAAQLRAQHDKQVQEINEALAEARRAESAARSDTDRMRRQVAALRKAADSPASERCAGFAELAVRCKDLVDRAGTALEFCDRALK
jgi:ATPase subunit of ABC transporter with duplicated ATPase domains